MTGWSGMRGKVGPMLVRKVFNCLRSLYIYIYFGWWKLTGMIRGGQVAMLCQYPIRNWMLELLIALVLNKKKHVSLGVAAVYWNIWLSKNNVVFKDQKPFSCL
jgi:hypothetical protein